MKKNIALLIVSVFLVYPCYSKVTPTADTTVPANLHIGVNEGIELLSVIQFLSGQLNNSTPSAYKAEVKKYFLPYRNHPAVVTMFMFEQTIYPDMVEWGMLLYNFPGVKMYAMPDSSNWYKMVPKEQLQAYLEGCMRFYKDTKFHEFYMAHTADYITWANALERQIADPVNVFNTRFNRDNKFNWQICLDPLNDWGAHTIVPGKLAQQLRNGIVYQLGYFGDKDAAGDMTFKTNVYDLTWHEGTHAVTDELLKECSAQIDSLAFLMKKDDALKKQNIDDWPHYFNELIARAVSIALHRKYRPQAEYEKVLRTETGRGFVHVKLVSDIIYDDYLGAETAKNFSDVLPAIFAALANTYK